MVYRCHIWVGTTQNHSLGLIVQKRLRDLIWWRIIVHPLISVSYTRDVLSLTLPYRYFHQKYLNELHSLSPRVTNLHGKDTYIEANQTYTLCVPSLRSNFHLNCFFLRSTALWNRLLTRRFPDNYNINLFTSRVDSYLPFLSAQIASSRNPLPQVTPGPFYRPILTVKYISINTCDIFNIHWFLYSKLFCSFPRSTYINISKYFRLWNGHNFAKTRILLFL